MEEKPSDWENQREKEESSRERRENEREGEEGPGRVVVVMVVVVVVMLDRARAGTMIQGPESERGLSETTVGDKREARGRKRRGRRGKKKRDRGGQDKTGQRQKKDWAVSSPGRFVAASQLIKLDSRTGHGPQQKSRKQQQPDS